MGKKMTDYEVLHMPFDIDRHKAHFINYFEVVLDPIGNVHYAVPSHQEFLIKYTCDRLSISRDELAKRCIEDGQLDIMEWLCDVSGCVSVWDYGIVGVPNEMQISMLRKLKDARLYKGSVHNGRTN